MTTIAASPLTEALQGLVNARLDTIDRMLLGRVNRHDRLAIVREVESQVFDLLQRHDGGPLDRDDVLAVLRGSTRPRLICRRKGSTAEARPARISTILRAVTPSRDARSGRIDLASGVLGIISTLILFLGLSIGIATQGLVIYFGSIGLGLILGLLAIIFAARARLRSAWAIVGLINGIVAMLASIAGGLFA